MSEVRANDDDDGVREALFESMTEIHVKYIDADIAPLEINIGSRLRRRIHEVFTRNDDAVTAVIPMDITKIMVLMEEATADIVKLMTEAAIRFSLFHESAQPSPLQTIVAV